jgi:cellulose synthase/poly-beta-1,6-N-acetylglucosamine synthase-like glycosyltransferase
LFFLSVVALRLLCFMPPVRREREPPPPQAAEAELPHYSVLVPLFRETAVLNQLMGALTRLRYPVEKLDIKLILEEEDMGMQAAVAKLPLPPQFEIIVVPAGRPQTKPRALNYALHFCRGELLTIYDAEDIPEPDQLAKAARRFAAAGPELACLQAQLTFFNPNENWLTRQFTAEYAMLFGKLLPVLADHRLPLPLGGTSNHFRTAVLRAVGGWDPFNVTEDADLGLRLARHGYETGTLDSLTYEEANTRLPNWMRQRARWLKGFLATWLVHMRDPARLMREVGPAGFWVSQAVTIGVFASVLLHPLCLLATFVLVVLHPALPEQAGLAAVAIAGVNLLVFFAGYVLAIVLTRDALRLRGLPGWRGTLATMPVYWLLMSGAAWLALWQFITAPFHWNKTEHGLSRFQGARAKRLPGWRGFRWSLKRGTG